MTSDPAIRGGGNGATGSRTSLRLLVLGAVIVWAAVEWRTHFRLVVVTGESMQPSLNAFDLLVIETGAYRHTEPRRGDVVVARQGRELIVKRIVGLPGETVEVRAGTLYVDGAPVPMPHDTIPGPLEIHPGHLASGRYALLGDNRSQSRAGTVHAVVAQEALLGRSALTIPLATWPRRLFASRQAD